MKAKFKPIRAIHVTAAPVQETATQPPELKIAPQPQKVAPSMLSAYISGMHTASRFRL